MERNEYYWVCVLIQVLCRCSFPYSENNYVGIFRKVTNLPNIKETGCGRTGILIQTLYVQNDRHRVLFPNKNNTMWGDTLWVLKAARSALGNASLVRWMDDLKHQQFWRGARARASCPVGSHPQGDSSVTWPVMQWIRWRTVSSGWPEVPQSPPKTRDRLLHGKTLRGQQHTQAFSTS